MIARIMPFLSVQRSPRLNRGPASSVQLAKLLTCLIVLALYAIPYTLSPSAAHAAPGINQTINFQGRLLNSDGTTVTDGNHSVVFSLYTVDTAGTNIWTETQNVTTTSGMFRISLGSVSSLASVDFNQDTLYLGIKVGSDSEMTPRLRFNAAPYAFMAETATNALSADTVDGLTFASGKTLTVNNSLTFTGTDSSSVNFGTGGTVCYSSSGCSVVADSLDFDDLADALTLDASTSIALGANTLSTSGTGGATFGHTGDTTFVGDVGIGVGSAAAQVEIRSTTEQLRLSYSDSARFTITVDSDGHTTLDATGSSGGITINDTVGITGVLAVGDGSSGTINLGDASISKSTGNSFQFTSGVTSSGLLTASSGFTMSAGTFTVPANAIADADVSNTLTSSIFIGTGSTTNAIDLGTAEVSGTLGAANIADDSLDFTKFADALALDASTDVALRANTLSTSGTGGIAFGHTGDTSFAGNIGIGDASPNYKLDVEGTLGVTGAVTLANYTVNGGLLFTNAAGALSQTAAAALVWDSTNSRLGIGNATPAATLDVDGTSILYNDAGGDGLLVGTSATTSANYALSVVSGLDPFTVLYARADGKIGFGTDTPSAQWDFYKEFSSTANENGLVVTASQSLAGVTELQGGQFNASFTGTTGTQAALTGLASNVNIIGNGGTVTNAYALKLVATIGNGATVGNTYNLDIDSLYQTGSSGSVDYGLSINSVVESGASLSARLGMFIGDAGVAGSLTTQTGIVIDNLDAATNNTHLLIGTSALQTGNHAIYSASTYSSTFNGALYINSTKDGTTPGADNQHLVLRNTSNSNGLGPGISFATSADAAQVGAKIVFDRTGGNSIGDLVFYTKPTTATGDTTVEALRINSDGLVGIGTDADQAQLEVINTNGSNWAGQFHTSTGDGAKELGGLMISRASSTVGNQIGIDFYLSDTTGLVDGYGYIGSEILDNTNGSEDGALVFGTVAAGGGNRVERMRLDSVGLGIGGPANNAKLEVEQPDSGWGGLFLLKNNSDNGIALIRDNSELSSQVKMEFFFEDPTTPDIYHQYGGIGAYIIDNTTASEDGGLVFSVVDGGGQADKMYLDDEGRLGIGDSTPTSKQEIVATYNALADVGNSFNYLQILRNSSGNLNEGAGLGFSVTGTDHNIGAALIFKRTNGNSMGELQFYTKQTTSGGADPALAMTLDDAGFIHVNLDGGTSSEAVCHDGNDTTSTNVKLFDCSGNPAADYAEMYPVASGITYGDIVSIGSQTVLTNNGQSIQQLVKSTAAYDAKSIGIVSDNYSDFSSTGYNIADTDNPMPVALVGRVPVKIASHSTAIEPGDYLTTSTQPGRAIKATQPGFMIGRALQAWDPVDQTDTIMVFVDNGYADPGSQVAGGISVDSTSDTTITSQTIQDLIVQGSLQVGGPAEFNGPAIFNAIAEFIDTVVFRNKVTFEQQVAFNQDAAGTATVPIGATSVDVTFKTPYNTQPIITASLSQTTITANELVALIEATICQYGDTLEVCQTKLSDHILNGGIEYIITSQSTTGFTIELANPPSYDVTFSWNATQIISSN